MTWWPSPVICCIVGWTVQYRIADSRIEFRIRSETHLVYFYAINLTQRFIGFALGLILADLLNQNLLQNEPLAPRLANLFGVPERAQGSIEELTEAQRHELKWLYGVATISGGADDREAAMVAVADVQPALDNARLAESASELGIGVTVFEGWPDIVKQALFFWADQPKPETARRAVRYIHRRLVEVEASPEAVAPWARLTAAKSAGSLRSTTSSGAPTASFRSRRGTGPGRTFSPTRAPRATTAHGCHPARVDHHAILAPYCERIDQRCCTAIPAATFRGVGKAVGNDPKKT